MSICCVQVLDQISTYLFHLHGASQTCPRLWRSAATFCSHQSLPICPAPGGCLNSWSQVFPSCERTPCDVLCLLCSFCPHLSDGGSAPQHVPPMGMDVTGHIQGFLSLQGKYCPSARSMDWTGTSSTQGGFLSPASGRKRRHGRAAGWSRLEGSLGSPGHSPDRLEPLQGPQCQGARQLPHMSTASTPSLTNSVHLSRLLAGVQRLHRGPHTEWGSPTRTRGSLSPAEAMSAWGHKAPPCLVRHLNSG